MMIYFFLMGLDKNVVNILLDKNKSPREYCWRLTCSKLIWIKNFDKMVTIIWLSYYFPFGAQLNNISFDWFQRWIFFSKLLRNNCECQNGKRNRLETVHSMEFKLFIVFDLSLLVFSVIEIDVSLMHSYFAYKIHVNKMKKSLFETSSLNQRHRDNIVSFLGGFQQK